MKKKSFIWIGLLAGLAACFMQPVVAQIDPHFSQYYVYPSYLNPALTGAFSGQYRVAGVFRNQWSNVGSPYSTKGISSDFTTDKNLNVGLSFMNQTAGDVGYNFNTGYVNAAYTGVKLGEGQFNRLVFGMQFGFIHRRFNPAVLTFGDQWTPGVGYNPALPTQEVLVNTSSGALDVGAGVMYFNADPGKNANLFLGASMVHLNKPTARFLTDTKELIPQRLTIHGGVRLAMTEVLTLTPHVLYMMQGTAREYMAGANAEIRAFENTALLAGLNYRVNESASAYFGLVHKTMTAGFSYDINHTSLARRARGANSFELSLTYIRPRKIKTEEVDFVCPRL